MSNGNPLEDTFEPIEAGGFDEEMEEARPKPLADGDYLYNIIDYVVSKTGGDSQVPGTPMVKFQCEVAEDDNPDNNGRKVYTQRFMLKGGGFGFFLSFAETVSPSRKWKGSKQKLLEANGESDYLDSFIDCRFVGSTKESMHWQTGEPTGFNEITSVMGVRK